MLVWGSWMVPWEQARELQQTLHAQSVQLEALLARVDVEAPAADAQRLFDRILDQLLGPVDGDGLRELARPDDLVEGTSPCLEAPRRPRERALREQGRGRCQEAEGTQGECCEMHF